MGTSAPGVSEDMRGVASILFGEKGGGDPKEPEGTEGPKDPYRRFTPKASSGLGGCGLLRSHPPTPAARA